jgi:branched-chain amino acid transport system permease protein
MSTSASTPVKAEAGGRTQPAGGGRFAFMDGLRARWEGLPKPVRILLLLLGAVLLYLLPLLDPPYISPSGSDFGGVLFNVAAYVLVALGLNVVLGYAGLLDLGYVGFYAVGAYTVGVLGSLHAKLPLLVLLPMAAIVATVSGVLLGAPTLRVRGDYLAIVTLGFGEIIRLTAVNLDWVGSAAGISNVPRPPSIELFSLPHLSWDGGIASVDLSDKTTFLKFGILDQIPYYWLALTVIFLILVGERLLVHSRVGRAWEATREDEDAAELMGVPTFRYKLMAFALGAAIGGMSGAFYASGQGGYINPQSFPLLLSMLFVAAVIVGGSGNRWGAIAGGALVAYLPERFREFADYRLLVFGLALTVLSVWRPEGLLPPRRTRRVKMVEAQIDALEEGELEGSPHG